MSGINAAKQVTTTEVRFLTTTYNSYFFSKLLARIFIIADEDPWPEYLIFVSQLPTILTEDRGSSGTHISSVSLIRSYRVTTSHTPHTTDHPSHRIPRRHLHISLIRSGGISAYCNTKVSLQVAFLPLKALFSIQQRTYIIPEHKLGTRRSGPMYVKKPSVRAQAPSSPFMPHNENRMSLYLSKAP